MSRNRLRTLAVLTVLLILVNSAAPLVRADSPSTAADTLQALTNARIPMRDPADLGKRLLGIKNVPPTPAAPKAYEIGAVEEFSAVDNNKDQDFTVKAKLWYKTAHVYMWFQEGFEPNLDAVKRSAENFENRIYPTARSYFGSEDSPGVDNDAHLFLLHARGLGSGIAGYFDTRSQYSRALIPNSNEHQIFFMNLDAVANQIGTPTYESILAHEFQHMIQANVDPHEQGFIDEGLAELSSHLCGYNDLGFIPVFMGRPETQLNVWAQGGAAAANYGASYAFLVYFLQRYGENAIRAFSATPEIGLNGLRSTLKAINARDGDKAVTLEELFADWTVTNLVNDKKVGDGRYAYTRFRNRPTPPATQKLTLDGKVQSFTTSQWGTRYIDITTPGTYRLKFTGQPTVKLMPANPHSGQKMWAVPSQDRSEARLTRTFDLAGVPKATLSFWVWYAMEQDWDYGYVQVSVDGGTTWKSIATEDSLAAGGHNNPYGPAYSGFSGSTPENRAPVWRKQTVDLTPFAGQKVMVRFSYLTDDAFSEAGMLIDDISIPEIGYSTDAETDDGGWQAEGWVRIANVLPQQYMVQMVELGSTPKVTRLISPSDAVTGEWTIKVGGDVSRVVIVVSGMTDVTRQAAPFTVAAAAQQ